MDHDDELPEPEVPEILHSVFSGRPFQDCVDCGVNLLQSEVPYAIEKAVRQGEVVFEYAICSLCTATLMKQFSEESIRNITAYLEQQEVDFGQGGDTTFCHRCGANGPDLADEHTITGMLVGSAVLMGPSILCGSCLSGIDDVLSQKTRDVHGDFIDSNFPGVSDTMDIPVSILGA